MEGWIGGLRRDCLDHLIALSEERLLRMIGSCVRYFYEDRAHLGFDMDVPIHRAVEPPETAKTVAFPPLQSASSLLPRLADRRLAPQMGS